jgi:DNA-binding MarR family transcriptional regulator
MRPIGYWVKELDRLIEETLERALAGEGLTRRHWQVLNTLAPGGLERRQVDEALAPFLAAHGATLTPVLDELTGRGWVATAGDELVLTDAGREALATLGETVAAARARTTDGITEQEYASTVAVLERMCANLA